jgi:hypothetical protein
MVHDDARELTPFSRDNLFVSIYEACKHRPDALSNANALTQTIIGLLRGHIHEGIIDRDTIVKIAALTLGRFDATAGTVYKAYHPVSV